jgi:uncharacterized protein with PIN domain
MKFLADGMLGKLTRWLRLAGQDVVYANEVGLPSEKQDDELLALSKLEGRMLLTSDVSLYKRARKSGVRVTLIRGGDVASQLSEVSKQIGKRIEITPESSRCPVCNGSLELVEKEKVKGTVPANVLKTRREFWRCTKCHKVYWLGTHWKTIIEMASRYNEMVR